MTGTEKWMAADPQRIPLTWRKDDGIDKALVTVAFLSGTQITPTGEAELEHEVRAELAAERDAIAAWADWRAKVETAQKEEASIKLQLERAELERKELLLMPAGTPELAARLGDNAAERHATTRMLERTAAGHQQLLQQAETARLNAERALRRIIDRVSTRLMSQAQHDMETAAQEAAELASAALTRWTEARLRLMYHASLGDVLLMRLRHLLDQVPASAAAPAELPAAPPARDESPALPATATLELPAGSDLRKVPLGIQTGQDGVATVKVQEAPPPAPVAPDAAWTNTDLAPQPVADMPPAIEQEAASEAAPAATATKPPRRRQRAE